MPPPTSPTFHFFPTLHVDLQLTTRQKDVGIRDSVKRLQTFRTQQRDPTAWVLLVDISGSISKFRATLRATVETLLEQVHHRDKVCVVAFNGEVHNVLAWTHGHDINTKVMDAVRERIRPKGNTNIIGAFQRAVEMIDELDSASMSIRMVLLTDGNHNCPKVIDPIHVVRSTCATLHSHRVTLMQVIIGHQVNEHFFVELQEWLKRGQARRVIDVENVPAVLGTMVCNQDCIMLKELQCNGIEGSQGKNVVFDTQTIRLPMMRSVCQDTAVTVNMKLWDGRKLVLTARVGELLQPSHQMNIAKLGDEVSQRGNGLRYFPCMTMAQDARLHHLPAPRVLHFVLQRDEFSPRAMSALRRMVNMADSCLIQHDIMKRLDGLSSSLDVSHGCRMVSTTMERHVSHGFATRVLSNKRAASKQARLGLLCESPHSDAPSTTEKPRRVLQELQELSCDRPLPLSNVAQENHVFDPHHSIVNLPSPPSLFDHVSSFLGISTIQRTHSV